MFIAWSVADVDWVEEIEIVPSFECEYLFNPLGSDMFFMRIRVFTVNKENEHEQNKNCCGKMRWRIVKKIFLRYKTFFQFNLEWSHNRFSMF